VGLVEEVKGRVLAEGMDLVGITPVHRLQDAPAGRCPTDILPTAHCVIVTAVHVLDSVFDLPYTRYEYTNQFFVLNSMLNSMAFKLSRYLESQGYRTIPIPAAYPRVNKEIFGILSHRHAAVQAGIGEMRTECQLACVRDCPVHAISEDGIVDKAKCLHYQEQIMPWSAVELRCGVCIASCPIGKRTWRIPAGSRSQKVLKMKERWTGARW